MSNFFNINNGFFTFLSKLCDVLFLSIIWVIVCIPIVTIGPANTALYYATVKVIRRDRGYLLREFFKSFRMNFKNAAIVGVLLTLLFSILFLDLNISGTSISSNIKLNSIFFGIYIAITFLILSFSIYAFPVLSRFDLNIKQLIRTAALMSIKHFLFTILMVLVLLAGIAIVVTIPMLIVVIPATVTLINSLLMERILKKYMPKADESQESNKDEWYLE